MWVRSQDKKTLVKVDKLIIAYDTDEKIYEIHNVYDSLGVYKSKERALEVLDEIQNLLIPKVILNTYSVENKETAYSKELVIEPIINDIKVQNNVNMFYQMPKE